MKFGLATYLSGAAEQQSALIDALSDDIAAALADKSYGESVKDLGIRLVLVETAAAGFIKPVTPKYYPGKRRIKNAARVEDYLDYEIRPDFGAFLRAEDKRAFLVREILASLEALDVPANAADFDKDKLRADLAARFAS